MCGYLTTERMVAFGTGAATGGALVGLGAYALTRRKKRKSRAKSKARKKRYHHYTGRKTPHTAGKRRDTSVRRIRYTSNGQPYIILRSGKARFIKKSNAKRSHRQSGGRY